MTLALVATAAGLSVLLGLKTHEITLAAPVGVQESDDGVLRVELAASVVASPKPTPSKTPAASVSKKPKPKVTAKPKPKPTVKPKATPKPTAKVTPTPTPKPSVATPGFTGPVVIAGPYGPVQVQILTSGTKITQVRAVKLPDGADDIEINDIAVPKLIQQTLDRQSAQIDVVSGATYTSLAYIKSLQAAIDLSRR